MVNLRMNFGMSLALSFLLFPPMVSHAQKMYWTDNGTDKIQRANLDGSEVEDLITSGLSVPYGIVVDLVGGKIYWADQVNRKIQRADLDGSNVQDLVTTGIISPLGIDLDVSGGKMYWTDQQGAKIQRADMDGSNVENLITTGLTSPTGIELDITASKMYWTDVGTHKIQRANLDGSEIEDLVTTGVTGPIDIALDISADKMYWTDVSIAKIKRADLDGSNVQELITTGITAPRGIDLDISAGKMYWTDSGTDKIRRANLDGSGMEDLVTTGLNDVLGIALNVSDEGQIFVDDDAPSDPAPGNPAISDPLEDGSPEHPFDAIQEAVNAAAGGDTVFVLDGTYTGNGNRDIFFWGDAITLRSQNGPNNCIIDCQGSAVYNRRAFWFIFYEGADSVLDGFTLENGYLSGQLGGIGEDEEDEGGGAIYCENSSPTIKNCIIKNNTVEYSDILGYPYNPQGGGIYCNSFSSPAIEGCTISGNTVVLDDIDDFSQHAYGGGISCINNSNASIINCQIDGNFIWANNGVALYPSAMGGGICIQNSSPAIVNCTIEDNEAYAGIYETWGGGVAFDNVSEPNITGCQIRRNAAVLGGGIYCSANSNLIITDCLVENNSVIFAGGGIFSYGSGTMTNCTFSNNSEEMLLCWDEEEPCLETYTGETLFSGQVTANNVTYKDSFNAPIEAEVFTITGVLRFINGSFDVASTDISGTGTIQVDLGAELIIEGNGIVDMAHANPVTDPDLNGVILCDGLLRVKDNVQLLNTNVVVTRASFEGDVDISNSVITAEAGSPYGQFFIEDSVHIAGNDIHADGDRYTDLDPSVFDGLIANNRIYVTITEGKGQERGGLLELRGQDELATSSCDPDEFFCQVDPGTMPGFDTNSWTFEELVVEDDAKVNLTNRFDFQEPYNEDGDKEVLYVKTLVLGDGCILNTAFNRIYYDVLVGDPDCVKNEPLLGFSLNNIALDDYNEFVTRVKHNNFVDSDPTPPDTTRIHVERVEGFAPDPNGMMRMKNIEIEEDNPDPPPDKIWVLYNARAKGLFAKSNEEEVSIIFEYLFETSNPNAELVIYLTDVAELQDPRDPAHNIEVARLPNPPAGRPGSYDSERFGLFREKVSVGNLNFVKGTRIEFELLGPDGTCILINNWDPVVTCTSTCGDVANNDHEINVLDFLTVIGECGQTVSVDNNGCLDGFFCRDGYVNASDVMAMDWNNKANLCSYYVAGSPLEALVLDLSYGADAVGGEPLFATSGLGDFQANLLVAGKLYDPSEEDFTKAFLTDRLYGFDTQGVYLGDPDILDSDQLNGDLIQDHQGEVYQINLEAGLIKLSDATSVIPSGTLPLASDPRNGQSATIYVGLQGGEGNWWGRPIMDATFDTQGYVYVVPVVVGPEGPGDPNVYSAAAKLELLPGENPPYSLVTLYDDENYNPNDNRQIDELREIEVDNQGNVYVLNSNSINESDILWVYGPTQQELVLRHPDNAFSIAAPVALCISDTNSQLYLTSSQNAPDANSVMIYGFSTDDFDLERTITVAGMGHITDIAEDPSTGTLWAIGFKMSEIPDVLKNRYYDYIQDIRTHDEPPFYQPYLAEIPAGIDTVEAMYLGGATSDPNNDLALPLSILWMGSDRCGGANLDGIDGVDLGDFAVLASYWLSTTCAATNNCNGADLAPEGMPDGSVDIADLRILARYWLETGCMN